MSNARAAAPACFGGENSRGQVSDLVEPGAEVAAADPRRGYAGELDFGKAAGLVHRGRGDEADLLAVEFEQAESVVGLGDREEHLGEVSIEDAVRVTVHDGVRSRPRHAVRIKVPSTEVHASAATEPSASLGRRRAAAACLGLQEGQR
jgi:hypothetical protein